MKSKYSFQLRAAAFIAAVVFIISFFIADLFRIQVIKGEEYSSKKISLSSVTSKITPLRGDILDCNGKELVYNVPSNTVYLDASYFPSSSHKEERNMIILSLIRLFEEYGTEYNSSLPIERSGDGFAFTENSDSDKKYLFKKDYLNLNSYATAQNCFDALKEYYLLDDLSADEALKIAGVFFLMMKGDFSTVNPFVFAENVPDELVLILKEQSRDFSGVETRIDTEREYYDGTIAPHIIGFYDYINADEYSAVTEEYREKLKDESLTDEEKTLLYLRSYGMTDKIGKFGIESAMENELRGTAGISTTVTNADGSKNTEVTQNPVNGNNVILTIDADFQKKVQEILSSRIDSTKDLAFAATAGSVVVMDVNDFSVLACATYPSYDLSTYKKNIAELSSDDDAPLWNRALRSAYAPGSTAKPAVSIAGLEEGIITADTKITCNILYTYFSDRHFICQNLGPHAFRGITVDEALRYSCNTFFYETGRQLGINKLGEYFSKFGLGQKTGVELSEETGMVAGPEERQAAGGVWYPGDTVQAAIGQSDNLFTPIQLAAYVSTLANGGTRYKAHFVKSIKSADYSETLFEAEPVVLDRLNISPSSLAVVKKGMIAMANSQPAFNGTQFQIASKTGTAEVKKRINGQLVDLTNGFMISYAPAENPQIAVVIAVENVTSSGMATYVREIYEAYFNSGTGITVSQQGGTVLR